MINNRWFSVKEDGLPLCEGRYWATVKSINGWIRNSITLYYFPTIDGEIPWSYDEDGYDECTDEVIAYMGEIIPSPYQGE